MKMRLFARFRDVLGEYIEINSNISVGEIKKLLRSRLPDNMKEIPILIAVNGKYVTDNYVINDDDEVVAFPPVSGG